jgi:hypothetical protein
MGIIAHRSSFVNGNGKQPLLAPPINGKGHAYKHLTKSQRAVVGVDVLKGDTTLLATVAIVARALRVSASYIQAAERLPPEQQNQVRRGELTIPQARKKSDYSAKQPKPLTIDDVVQWWLTTSDDEHAAVVRKVGVTTPWDAIAANL